MHDPKTIASNPKQFENAMRERGVSVDVDLIKALDEKARSAQQEADARRSQRNDIAANIGKLMAGSGSDLALLAIENGKTMSKELQKQEEAATIAQKVAKDELNDYLATLPNIRHPSVPLGGEENNSVEKEWEGAGLLQSIHHADMGMGLWSDYANKPQGSRLTAMRGAAAKLSRAITQYMLDMHTKRHGYEEFNLPVLVSDSALFGTGQLPKFEDDLYRTKGAYLAPTAEVMLTNMVADNLFVNMDEFPIRMVAYSLCFRSEAGSAGRDTRGILRQNQFEKVELVSITHPDQSEEELERMTWCAEQILEGLELPYRRVLLAAEDMGFAAQKTYDLEVWMAGEGVYREISSCSLCGDFQMRRMNTRIKDGKKRFHPHSLNGSALAVGRTLAAVMEYYRAEDGGIDVPTELIPYFGPERLR